MRILTVAAVQMSCSTKPKESIEKAEDLVLEAVNQGAKLILLPELFERQYFCQERRYDYYAFAKPVMENDAVKHFLEVPLKRLKTAVLVDRNHKKYPVKADFKGISLSTSLQEHIEVRFGENSEAYLH